MSINSQLNAEKLGGFEFGALFNMDKHPTFISFFLNTENRTSRS